jgi:hypothetical protein
VIAKRSLLVGVAALALLGACSDDDDDSAETGTSSTTTTTEATTTSTAGEASTTSTTAAPVESDPHDAAEAFMVAAFPGTNATLGDFQQGDARSGEIPVLRPAEGGGTANLASTLLLRLDDADQWQVFGAFNEFVTIDAPDNSAEVPPGPLVVSGAGRGFEALLVARALDGGQEVAQETGSGGSAADPLPYEITLDLSSVASGTELVVIVNGGVGLENDPGEFSAITVTVA